jgi:[ribosomal protein S5]-alanine N-acetyltransferase
MIKNVVARQPTPEDQPRFLESVLQSHDLHRPWVKPPATAVQFDAYLARMALPENCAFLICNCSIESILGVVNITNITRGPFQSGYLGYYAFSGHEGQGLMREGLLLVLHHAFKSLKLHRLEANIQPGNLRSIGLVESCGFQNEGFSKKYLKVGGRWRDHERWAILAS